MVISPVVDLADAIHAGLGEEDIAGGVHRDAVGGELAAVAGALRRWKRRAIPMPLPATVVIMPVAGFTSRMR